MTTRIGAAGEVEHKVMGRRARLVLSLDPNVPEIRDDPVQLQQVLINLTLNALDAVSASASEREAAISTTRNNGYVEVHVSDSAPGLLPRSSSGYSSRSSRRTLTASGCA